MRETITSKKITVAAAIALFALAFVPATFAASPPTSMSLYMTGIVGNPSNGLLGSFSITLASIPGTTFTRGALVQGGACGTYTDSIIGPVLVCGGWSYDTATGKALMKLAPADGSFSLNLAFLNLNPNIGFTFQGIIHVNGQAPVMLSSIPALGGVLILTFS